MFFTEEGEKRFRTLRVFCSKFVDIFLRIICLLRVLGLAYLLSFVVNGENICYARIQTSRAVSSKGQLVLKCPFGVKTSKKQNENFCPSL